MKIVFTHTDFRIYWPARLAALHSYLAEKSIEMQVVEISGEGSPYEFDSDRKSHPAYWSCLFPDKRMEDLPSSEANKALRKKLDELQPDIVFSGAIAFPSGAAAVRWAKENRRKCVVFDDARLEDVPRKWYVNFIKKSIYSSVDAIFCPSPAWDETFSFFGLKGEQLFYGLNVVNNDFWKEEAPVCTNNLPKRYFLTVGRQIIQKNFLLFLESYYSYYKTCAEPVDLIFVGKGPMRKMIENYITEKGLTSVHMFPFVTQNELKAFYQNALCLFLPSRRETWGLVVNEAMASGLPVIVSEQVGCATTLVKDNYNGFTFSPDDSLKLAEIMETISIMPEEIRKVYGNNSLEIIENWGIKKFCSGVYEAIQYVRSHPFTKSALVSLIILKLWKGRYRPI